MSITTTISAGSRFGIVIEILKEPIESCFTDQPTMPVNTKADSLAKKERGHGRAKLSRKHRALLKGLEAGV